VGWAQPGSLGLMLDHLFLDAVAALSQALDDAMLERQPGEDRLAADILAGDLVWETSCSLPGEGEPPRVRADLTLDWPTWSQAAWRSWTLGHADETGDAGGGLGDMAGDEPPEIGLEVVLRVQRLATRPEVDHILAVLPEESPEIGTDRLERSGPVIEESYQRDLTGRQLAVEVAYEGTYRLTPDSLERSKELGVHLAHMGAWIASTLVRLGDLRLEYLPPDGDGG
jgi:hypothetical protein